MSEIERGPSDSTSSPSTNRYPLSILVGHVLFWVSAVALTSLLLAGWAWGQYPGGNCQTCPGGTCRLNAGWSTPTTTPTTTPSSAMHREIRAAPPAGRVVKVAQHRSPAFVRVTCEMPSDRPGYRKWSIGTGTIIDPRGYVVSCAHNTPASGGGHTITLIDGRRLPAQLVGRDELGDLALFRVNGENLTAMRVGEVAPAVGDVLRFAGYGEDNQWRVCGGTVRQMARTPGLSAWEEPEITGSARQGDSGGPIWNTSGHLVGVLSGTGNGGYTVCCSLRRLRTFLHRLLPPYPVARAAARAVLPPYPRVRAAIAAGQQPRPATSAPKVPVVSIVPPTPNPQPPSPDTSVKVLQAAIQALVVRVAVLEAREPIAGPAGKDGINGTNGKDANWDEIRDALEAMTVEIDARIDAVQATADEAKARALKPIYVRQLNVATGEVKTEEVFLGEGFTFRLYPEKK